VDVDAVRRAMEQTEGVCELHDLHVWSITSGIESLSGHVVVAQGESHADVLRRLRAILADRFGIHHVTIQIEAEGCDAEDRH
jgi:cobalt-zinc-cadmium efflux system protein